MKKPILQEGKKYTFNDYFDLPQSTDDVVAELGYSFSQEVVSLLRSTSYNVDDVKKLQNTLYFVLPNIATNSEIAKREFLIAPILLEVTKATSAKIKSEYPLDIDEKLSGSLDYFVRLNQDMIIIEAKKGDLDKGFTQLSAELIALDKYEEDSTNPILYGAISIGNVWQFGMLHRDKKHITKDLNGHMIPEDIEEVVSILIGILTASS